MLVPGLSSTHNHVIHQRGPSISECLLGLLTIDYSVLILTPACLSMASAEDVFHEASRHLLDLGLVWIHVWTRTFTVSFTKRFMIVNARCSSGIVTFSV